MAKIIYPVVSYEKSLPFYLTGIGICNPEYHVVRETGLVSHQILYTKSGKGVLVLDGASYPQSAGSCFYLQPGIPHEYYPDGDNWETCWLVFRGVNINEIMTSIGFNCCVVRDLDATDTLQKLFGKIYMAAQNSYNGGFICSHLIYEYILETKRLLLDGTSKNGSGTVIEYAVSMIENSLGSDITLEQLSDAAGISPQHFCRVFRAYMGMRPMEYLARKRISAAKSMLDDTEKSVAVIGELCGYPNQSYFGVVFKKYEGVSPTEYRSLKRTLKI